MVEDQIQVFELVARLDEGAERFALAHTDDEFSGLTQTGGQPRKVAVRRDDAESVQIAAVEQVHGVNDHGAVGCIFAGGVAILLDGNDGVVQQHILPAFQAGIRPIAVNTFAGRHAKGRSFIQNHLYICGADVIRIDQNCQFQILHRSLTSLPV